MRIEGRGTCSELARRFWPPGLAELDGPRLCSVRMQSREEAAALRSGWIKPWQYASCGSIKGPRAYNDLGV